MRPEDENRLAELLEDRDIVEVALRLLSPTGRDIVQLSLDWLSQEIEALRENTRNT